MGTDEMHWPLCLTYLYIPHWLSMGLISIWSLSMLWKMNTVMFSLWNENLGNHVFHYNKRFQHYLEYFIVYQRKTYLLLKECFMELKNNYQQLFYTKRNNLVFKYVVTVCLLDYTQEKFIFKRTYKVRPIISFAFAVFLKLIIYNIFILWYNCSGGLRPLFSSFNLFFWYIFRLTEVVQGILHMVQWYFS